MRTILAAVLTLGLVVQGAQPPEPYPGSRNHEKPPEGWTCSRDAEDKAHLCFCTGMQKNTEPMCHKPEVDDPDTEEDESLPSQPPEDAKCKTYCYRSSCTCKEFCDT